MEPLAWYFRLWNRVHQSLVRWRLIHCWSCDNGGAETCDCGVADLPSDVGAGHHYKWCLALNGCSYCGRDTA